MDIELEVKNISFRYQYGNSVLSDLNFSMKSPEIFCILGSNGTGKSTLLKCLIGIEKIKSGAIYYNKKNLNSFARKELAKFIAYVPQSNNIQSSFTVLEMLLMGRTAHIGYFSSPKKKDVEIALENLEFLQIIHLKDEIYCNLSGGEKQLVRIASVLTQNPKIILFDEPTSHLDFGNQYRFLKILKALSKKGIGSIMTTHFPDHVSEVAHMAGIMKNNKFHIIGKPDEVITKENIENLYDIKVEIIENSKKRLVVFQD